MYQFIKALFSGLSGFKMLNYVLMKKTISILSFIFLVSFVSYGTHNRAGEITYKYLGGYSFEFTVTTYTYQFTNANRAELPVNWGDGSYSILSLVIPPGHKIIPNTDYFFNTYIGTHTFPGTGVYEILMEDPNRNLGVKNIPNSVNTIFSIKTTMLVGSTIGANNTPVLLNPPIDKAAKGHIFMHNPAAYDSDGDSLSYMITTCTGENGDPIEGYMLPPATDTLMINEISGDLIWNTPAEVGVYNIAIFVDEWRKGVRIGRIERDMQIDVYQSENNPPVNSDINDICVRAGDTVNIVVYSTDADLDSIIQTMNGGPFEVKNPAVFKTDTSRRGYVRSTFRWITDCSNARQQPYYLVLKSMDLNDDIQLVDLTSFSIKVIHPAPENLRTFPGMDSLRLEWDIPTCVRPSGYKIYRSLSPYEYIPDSCETGVPEYTGFKLLEVVKKGNINWYKDDNKGSGLVPGYDYCYRITSIYDDGAESQASAEACTTLVSGTPAILKVSVEADNLETGIIDIAWALPRDLDTSIHGPFRYEVLRKGPFEENFITIAELPTNDLTDTLYTDKGINTLIYPYTYSIVLHYQQNGVWFQLPGNEFATSQYIEITPSDNTLALSMKKRSPWLNTQYDIYRGRSAQDAFVQVGSTPETVFFDTLLINNLEYFYRTTGIGRRPLYNSNYFTENKSHIASGIPIDTVPPCPPADFFVESKCENNEGFNELSWKKPDTCLKNEVIAYKLYFRNSMGGDFFLIDSLAPDIFEYTHKPDSSIEGCYSITAVDSTFNESAKIPFCVFNLCGLYSLPNVFTPNNDRENDLYKSFNLNNYVKKVDMTIFNRYGKVVFKTQDPVINWDGRNKENNKLVSPGVYYYICDVYEPRISGPVVRTLTGFIHVYTGENNGNAE
jgi:gliding motility-associated-like protein